MPPMTAAFRSNMPRGIWALGLCSLFMDVSSELVHSLLPVLLTTVLGSSMLTVGLIEGVAEATAAITKVFSGSVSDWLGRRKWLAVSGYALAALTKPAFPLADSAATVFAARFADRIGKGIRGAPRDALVADLVPPAQRGAAYGLRQTLDSVGAFLGPLLAILALAVLADDVRAAMWVAVPFGFIAVAVLAVGVREPASTAPRERRPSLLRGWRALPKAYWQVVTIGAVFTLARFSEAFLILRAQDIGLALHWLPGVLIVMNVVYAASSYPAGVLSDRLGSRALLLAGLAVLIGADGLLAAAHAPWAVLAGAALWGLHMGLTQGLLARRVADTAPDTLRGTAFGVFNLIGGIALFLASALAGGLWAGWGAPATFACSAGLAALAMLGVLGGATSGRPDAPR
ncbi:MFS transporter [Nitrogeniibacter mangrovi]|uniref:MFS transporter n=1 Tax=Nitrogeniibacter mangrovi TaxID=2016596 RepID=A0A6C1BAI0_9RHOO|nr:MFS transporter [Nitrogeniibacter mangrovi]QID19274.1 MFS transporter [Nitrogeniibacter mangrovi]